MAPKRRRLAAAFGLVTSVAALAAGGIAMGLELERRIVAKRITRTSVANLEAFFSLRSEGLDVTMPDGVVLHTEVDEGAEDDLTLVYVHGYALNLIAGTSSACTSGVGCARSSTTSAPTAGQPARRQNAAGFPSWPRTCTRYRGGRRLDQWF